jgi:hypothetical protein
MDSIWSRLPDDIFTNHILPYCNIDIRLAFKIKPKKIDLQPYESGEFRNTMKRRYTPLNPSYQWDGKANVLVPLHTVSGWMPGFKEGKRAMLNYSLIYDFNSYHMRKDFKQCMRIFVNILDYRDPNMPTNLSKEEREIWIQDYYPVSRDMVVVWIKPCQKP